MSWVFEYSWQCSFLNGACDGCEKDWFNHPIDYDEETDRVSKSFRRNAKRKGKKELTNSGWLFIGKDKILCPKCNMVRKQIISHPARAVFYVQDHFNLIKMMKEGKLK